ncbi:hypothetical protein KBZ21_20770 [Streptomyces sp. A73]|uniref:hypothetical protein n=1 Tax=unclassified Streptomyces TaxID=2593676 RepID=UPI0016073BC0|nr:MULTISPECIES: hypothetical protein [unclassified Streptomyces]MBQ0864622.1 hypothetical protein [Streptomyces sp. RK75]MBQ1120779.1 hypothetical protein [Streptomyces sp. B15]MBQ1160506.1 hypothetical protein [Streptomyces sp. A73]
MHGGEQVRGTRRAAAVLVAVLLALSAAVHLAGASSAPSAPSASTAATAATEATVATEATAASGVQPTASATVSADDSGPSRCHKSQDGGGALPAVPASGQQQLLPLALPVCLTPQSHSAIGAAHAGRPLRGPAPIPPPTPVELSVLRV